MNFGFEQGHFVLFKIKIENLIVKIDRKLKFIH